MKPPQIAVALIAAGCVCGLISLVFPSVVGGKAAYTEEDAVEYQEASLQLHNARAGQGPEENPDDAGGAYNPNAEPDEHEHGHSHERTDAAEVKAAEERMAAIESKRDAAVTRGQTTATIFKWLGIIVGAAGIVTHFATRNSAA